jgi:hypothetical protein
VFLKDPFYNDYISVSQCFSFDVAFDLRVRLHVPLLSGDLIFISSYVISFMWTGDKIFHYKKIFLTGCTENVHKKVVEVFLGPFDLRLAIHKTYSIAYIRYLVMRLHAPQFQSQRFRYYCPHYGNKLFTVWPDQFCSPLSQMPNWNASGTKPTFNIQVFYDVTPCRLVNTNDLRLTTGFSTYDQV